jgi:SAM-dependent methyltransferase
MGNIKDNRNVRQRWQSNWSHYIQGSRRHSSSAVITADNFIEMGRISEGSRIVDLGCGHGRITELLIEKVPSLEIVGVDMTRPLLDHFLVKSGSNGSKIQLMCADIATLPLNDNSFDVAVSSRVFQYLPDPLLGLREAVRVLKPGGRLVISMPNRLNPIKYFTYHHTKVYSSFEVASWFLKSQLEDIHCRSMCFFPPSRRWQRLALFLEVIEKVPFAKYLGGNVVVSGKKKIANETRHPEAAFAAQRWRAAACLRPKTVRACA